MEFSNDFSLNFGIELKVAIYFTSFFHIVLLLSIQCSLVKKIQLNTNLGLTVKKKV
jgi:hypothetical protein